MIMVVFMITIIGVVSPVQMAGIDIIQSNNCTLPKLCVQESIHPSLDLP
jgi:hypothetical protein